MEKTIEELQSDITKLESDKAGLVGETQDLRKSRQEKEEEITVLKDLLQKATDKNNASPEDEKIASVVASELAKRELGRSQNNRKAAFDKFVKEHKEYLPDNDTGGLKRGALEREFNSFNTQGAVEVEDFEVFIGKADRLLRGEDTARQNESGSQPYSSQPNNATPPVGGPDTDLTPQEKKLIDRNGWTKEKYLALKAKDPDYFDKLAAQVR